MADNNNTNLKEDLEKIYADISEWLKFAETKHAAALALWTALIVAVMTEEIVTSINFTYYCILVILLIAGMLLDVVSFIPFLDRKKLIANKCYKRIKKKTTITDNLVFYQNIFLVAGSPKLALDIRVENYKNKLKLQYNAIPQDVIINAYIEQIVSVATVATIKVYLFNIVARYILCLVLAAILCIIIA